MTTFSHTHLLVAMEDIGVEIGAYDSTLPTPPGHGEGEAVLYSSDPQVKGTSGKEWGPRWPNCAASNQRRAAGGGVAVNIHKELAPLTAGLLAATLKLHGYVLHQDQTGAFVCRPIGGTNSASNHSVCTAIDLNWRENPFSYNPRYTLPQPVIDMWTTYGWMWGGYWQGKKDTMHFEWIKSIEFARTMTARFYNVPVEEEELSERDERVLNQIRDALRG